MVGVGGVPLAVVDYNKSMKLIINLAKSKPLLIAIAIGVVFALILALFSVQNPTTTNNTAITPTPAPPFVVPTGDKIQIKGAEVNNFYNESKYTYPSGTTIIEENNRYQIVYDVEVQEFIVTIYVVENDSRTEAEQALLSNLNIDKTEACKLNVVIRKYHGLNLRATPELSQLSFCN